MQHEIIKRASIDEVIAERHALIASAAEAFDQLDALQTRFQNLGGDYVIRGLLDDESRRELIGGYRDKSKFLARVTKNVDQGVWEKLLGMTGFEALMDKQARDEWRKSLEEPVEPTAETALLTMQSFVESADMMYRRGIAQAFAKLDRRFKSHDGFKVGGRVVLSNALSGGYWSRDTERTLYDVDRAFHQIERGEPVKEIGAQAVTDLIEAKRREHGFGAWSARIENDLFKIDVFKNGNVHLWFKRKDLVEKVNRLLAEYYGATLGQGFDAAFDEDAPPPPNRTPAKNFGFYATPDALAERVAKEMEFYVPPGESRCFRVLEPSAGTGQLVRATIEAARSMDRYSRRGDVSLEVTMVEVQQNLAGDLRAAFPNCRVLGADFFDQTPERLGLFDRIIMNPPFDRERDIDHVLHAYKFLAPGGTLFAIMASSIEFRESKKAIALRKLVDARNWRSNGWIKELPERSFAPLTNVNTVLVKLTKPMQDQ
ncbi:MAG: DUF4942 domain-containing protein [Pseudomonadota bacterium]|nr:DUF4942 domain-containing protein [Pseudomonadota bacterium]